MGNSYLQALKAYELRLRSSKLVCTVAVIVLIMAVTALVNGRRGHSTDALPVVFAVSTVAITHLWIHFREAVVSTRRRLIPGYTRPHLIAFLTFATAYVIAWPVLLMVRGQSHSIATMAGLALMFALTGWFVLTLSWIIFAGGFLIYTLTLWNALGSQAPAVIDFFRGGYEPFAYALLVGSLFATGMVLMRMVRLEEEDDLYHRRMATNAWEVRARSTGDGDRTWSQKLKDQNAIVSLSEGRLYLARTDGLFDRARQWRSLKPNSAGFMAVMAVFMLGTATLTQQTTGKPNATSFIITTMWLFQMPSLPAAQVWMRQWRFLEMDFLRPISRGRLLREIGVAMAIDTLQSWLIFAVVFFAMSAVAGMADPGALAITVAASLAMQVFLFASAVWILRYRSPHGLAFGLTAINLLPVIGFSIGLAQYPALYAIYALPASLLLALIGLLIAKDACRRWMDTELG